MSQTPVNVKKVPVNFVVKKRKVLQLDEELEEDKEEKLRNQILEELKEKIEKSNQEADDIINKAKIDYDEVLKNADSQKQEIINIANENAKVIEKEAYEKGYDEGRSNGYEDGYKEAYDDNIEKAKEEYAKIIDDAEVVLQNAHNEVAFYMKENKQNIMDMILTISEKVLREKLKDTTSMNTLVNSVIEEYELKENFVIRINPMYKESIEKEIENLKLAKKIESQVFVLEDSQIKEGNAQIDTENGKIILGIDSILQKVKEELI